MPEITRNERETRGSRSDALRAAVLAFGAIAVFEIACLGPVSQWFAPRIWIYQVVFVGILAAVAAALGSVAFAAARAAGWPIARFDGALAAAWVAIAATHVLYFGHPLVAHRIAELSRGALAFALGAVAIAGYALLRFVLARLGVTGSRVIAPAALALLAPIAAAAGLAGGADASSPMTRLPFIAVGVLLFGVALLASARLRAPLRLVAFAGCVLAPIALLRSATVNPHDRIVSGTAQTAKAPGPPVIFIVLDTFRADALDLRDPASSRTPNLARFLAHADVYPNAVANGSWTLPGHASLFTGRLLAHHRTDATAAPGFAGRVAGSIPTAPEVFAAAGYATACVSANGIVNPRSGLARGCQRYQNPGRSWVQRTLPYCLVELAGDSTGSVSQLLLELFDLNVNANGGEIVDAGLREIEQGPSPLFLFLNFLDVHGPLDAPADVSEPSVPARRAHRWDEVRRLFGRIDESTLWRNHASTLHAYYQARVRVLDGELGRFLAALEQRGVLDGALVVITADHGEGFFENPDLPGYFGHHSAYEPAVRIPLIVKAPGQREGRRIDRVVQQADVLPTLVALAGLPPVAGVDGVSLADPAASRPVVTEWYARLDPGSFPFVPDGRAAIYDGRFKFVVDARGVERLYDLSRSPFEAVDVLTENPELVARLRDELRAAVHVDPDSLPAAAKDDPRLKEQLRALGYVQ